MKNILKYLKETYTTWFLVKIQIYEMLICLIPLLIMFALINKPILGLIYGIGLGIFSNIMLLIARWYSLKEKNKRKDPSDHFSSNFSTIIPVFSRDLFLSK